MSSFSKPFGISFGALRIAGGLTVALIGYRMLFSGDTVQGGGSGSFAFSPAGWRRVSPDRGAGDLVIGISSEIAELAGGVRRLLAYMATVVASIAATCLLIWLVPCLARWVSRRLGPKASTSSPV